MKGKTPRNGMAVKQMTRANKGTFGRLLKYLWKYYKWQVLVMMATLLFSSFAMIIANVFLQKIIDNCITPGLSEGWNAVLPELARLGGTMIIIFCFGILSSYLNNQLNAVITQGMLYRFRKNMFENMETLPIKYFDTHQHGTIMSTYTNDTDAVRQLIGQSLPTLFQSAFTLLAIFIFMAYYSIYLTLLVIGVIVIMMLVVMRVGGASGKYMVRQQAAIANEEGYVEEMINGQKVVKVFNHEDEAKEGFDKLNEQLNHDGYKAHKYGNILMPILGNMGNIMYVLLAFVGGILILAGVKNVGITGFLSLTPGIIVAYLSLSRQLSNNIGQMSAQISMVTMGLAGASRVFELIDEQPEKDEGYVMLVNAKKD